MNFSIFHIEQWAFSSYTYHTQQFLFHVQVCCFWFVFCFKFIMVLVPFCRTEDIKCFSTNLFSRITNHLNSCIFPMKRSSLWSKFKNLRRKKKGEINWDKQYQKELVEWVQLERESEEDSLIEICKSKLDEKQKRCHIVKEPTGKNK